MNKTSKLLILDKDGTIVETKSGATFVNTPEDQKLMPGVEEAIALYIKDGWDIAIASNQGGVQAGYKTLNSAFEEMQFCLDLVKKSLKKSEQKRVLGAAFCPDDGSSAYLIRALPELNPYPLSLHECYPMWAEVKSFRKPGPGMLAGIINLLYYPVNSPDYTNILMVGNRPEGEGAAKAAGVQFLGSEEWRKGQLSL